MAAVRTDDVLPAKVDVERLRWWRGSVPIAITGSPGCGKTLMYDALMDDIGFGYTTKDRSADWERHRVRFRTATARTRASVLVAPGQKSTQRTRSLDQIFGQRRGPVGLVHVVCWGYNRRWQWDPDTEFEERAAGLADERRARADEEVPKMIRRDNLSVELEDFREVCQRVKSAGARQRIQWLVVVVAKADLYWSDVAKARSYYVPAPTAPARGDPPESGFCRALRTLVKGDTVRRLAIVPFAGYLEPHDFGNGVQARPQLASKQIATLRNNFCDVLGGML